MKLVNRFQLAWMTIAALVAMAIVVVAGLGAGVVKAELAADLTAFRAAVAPGDNVDSLNQVRASLVADMVFLVAYGLLLRQSVHFMRHPWSRGVGRLAVVTMLADATENLTALYLIERVMQSVGPTAQPDSPQIAAIFRLMHVASTTKWALAGVVGLFLAYCWTVRVSVLKRSRRVPVVKGGLRVVAALIAVAFLAGGVGSLAVAASGGWGEGSRRVAATAALAGPAIALLLQLRMLHVCGPLLRFLSLARAPLILLATTSAFGPLALGSATALLGGILDVSSWLPFAVLTAGAVVLAFACGTQINLIRAYAFRRMLDPTLRVLRPRAVAHAVLWTTVVVAGSLIFSAGVGSPKLTKGPIVQGVGAGLFVGLGFVLVVEWLAALMTSRQPAMRRLQFGTPLESLPVLGPWLRQTRQTQAPARLLAVKGVVGHVSIAGWFGPNSGYVDGNGRLLAGHTFATIQFLLSLGFYAALVYVRWGVVSPRDIWVPTLASITLLLLLWSWGLSAATFFLDRYRWPLFTVIIAAALGIGSLERTDHVIKVTDSRTYPLASPGQVLRKFTRPIVVAAAGGGIQAGAWTARVLQGLAEELGPERGRQLRDRLTLVTGVSGGSMGAMFYGAYRDDPSKATTQSEQPSLDEVASALIGPDLLRAFGAKLERGRGEALERSWAARLPDPEHPLTLAAWADRTGRFVHGSEDPFPAFLFDATIVETGQAMAFTTTQFPSPGYRSAFDRRSRQSPIAESANLVFDLSDGDASMGGGADLQVATAARLSAAFPFVSPAATLQTAQGKRFHVVDGGYYDNYGLVVTSQWLDDALEEISKGGRFDVAMALDLVIARTLVDATQDVVAPIDAQKPEGPWRYTASAKSHGWAWQATAPVLAFVNGRTFGQWTGGNQVLRLLIDKWRWRNATIRVHLFDLPARQLRLPCRVEPLSWKLTEPQRACMSEGWEKVKTKVAALQR